MTPARVQYFDWAGSGLSLLCDRVPIGLSSKSNLCVGPMDEVAMGRRKQYHDFMAARMTPAEPLAAVRRAQSDAEFELFQTLLTEYEAGLPADLRHGIVSAADALRGTYAQRNAAFLAYVGESVAGCVAVAEVDTQTAMVLRLFVKTENRGSGIARILVNTALDFLREHSYANVVLDTDKNRLNAAYQLYRSLGFEECAPHWPVQYQCPTFMKRRI